VCMLAARTRAINTHGKDDPATATRLVAYWSSQASARTQRERERAIGTSTFSSSLSPSHTHTHTVIRASTDRHHTHTNDAAAVELAGPSLTLFVRLYGCVCACARLPLHSICLPVCLCGCDDRHTRVFKRRPWWPTCVSALCLCRMTTASIRRLWPPSSRYIHSYTDRGREREKERDRHTHAHRQTHTHTDTHSETRSETQTEGDAGTHRHTERHT
jgi:hypothetical protein